MPEKRDLTGYFNEVNAVNTSEIKIREAIDNKIADTCDYDSAEFYFETVRPYAHELHYPDVGNRFDPFFDIDKYVSKLKLIKEYVLHNRIAYLKNKTQTNPKSVKGYMSEIRKCEMELEKLTGVKVTPFELPKDETL